MIISLDLFSKFETGESYVCKSKEGYTCIYTVIDRSQNTVTFEKKYEINKKKFHEYKKFKINFNGFMEQVLVWAYQDKKCYLRACNRIIDETTRNEE